MSIYGLRLAGWDELSTWGYDAGAGSLYAQLTRNGNSDDDGPDIWITPPDFPAVLVPTALAAAIAAATGSELPAVYVAMNAGLDGQTDDMAHALRLPAPDHGPLTTQPEQPWMPGHDDLPPWTTFLINPHGDRHLGFNDDECQFYRIWQHRPPEPLHTGDAILLRPSDIDQIIMVCMMWVNSHPGDPRWATLSEELSIGAKSIVLHYAELAGAEKNYRRYDPGAG